MSPKRMMPWMLAALLVMAAACGGGEEGGESAEEEAAAAEDYFEVDPATAATVSGKVSLEGEPQELRPINMSAEPDCHELHDTPPKPEVIVKNDNGTLKNVFVWVKSGLEGKNFRVKGSEIVLDQKGCIYQPHVLAVQAGQQLNVNNSDPTTHNVHPLPRVNREWNKSQSPGAPSIEYTFARQEIMIPVKCNIHPWMRSYVSVVDHPFFGVTGDDGTFNIQGLPPGTYTVEAAHEQLGSKEMEVTLGDAESKEIEFNYSVT